MTEYSNAELGELDRIEDLLVAYADGQLSPSGPLLARIRATAMAQAAASAAVAAAERPLPHLQAPRRGFALGLAATMALVSSAAVLAAPPGSLFYDARVALEAALLPTQVDARLALHEQHLSERLAEAQAAAASGDPVALEAALAAYAREVDAVVGDIGDDADLLAHLEAVLAKHVAVLTALHAKVPEQASVDQAIESSQKAVETIRAKGRNDGGRPEVPLEVPGGLDNPQGRG